MTGKSDHLFDVIAEHSLALAAKKLGCTLINNSVFGNIITKAQRTLLRGIDKGLTCDVGIIESGGNDCDYDWALVSSAPGAPHKPRVELPDFIRVLHEMIATLRAHRITPLLMTMPPLVPERWYKTITAGHNEAHIRAFLGGDRFRPYINHERYSLAIMYCARELNVQLVDMRKALLEAPDYRQLMCTDGIHPNEAGHQYLAAVWERELPLVRKEF
ncbi:MAG: SGNH/GDSL hydrolase family protein [Treponema sp.]|nr:SGNH/GDSL hydrolase family protein [Treponema sp.]